MWKYPFCECAPQKQVIAPGMNSGATSPTRTSLRGLVSRSVVASVIAAIQRSRASVGSLNYGFFANRFLRDNARRVAKRSPPQALKIRPALPPNGLRALAAIDAGSNVCREACERLALSPSRNEVG